MTTSSTRRRFVKGALATGGRYRVKTMDFPDMVTATLEYVANQSLLAGGARVRWNAAAGRVEKV